MGRSESGVRCKKHPKHRQSPGVCSFCLREKLSQLSTSSNNKINTTSYFSSSSFSSSLYTSVSSSSCSSPIRHRVDSAKKSSFSFLLSGKNGLMRSRSMAFVAPKRVKDSVIGSERKKKGGFWSKLIQSSNKSKKDMFMHSKTVREVRTKRLF